jgi:tetratricopeptide (TPR) repeat protein
VAAGARAETDKPLLARAQELFESRRFAEAVDLCTRMIAEDVRRAEAYHLRGKALLLEGRPGAAGAAIDDFTAAIRLANRLPEAYFDRGILQLETGSAEAALADLAEAVRQGMTGREVAFYRGMAYLQTGRFREASDELTAAIRIDPALAAAYLNRGVARYQLDLLKEAQADYERAIKLAPHLARAFLNRGVVRLKRGDLEGAISDFDLAIEESHHSGDRQAAAPAYFDRGRAFFLKGDFERAIDDWEHLVRDLDERDPMTLDQLGLAYGRLDNEARALRYLEDAVRLDHAHSYAPAHAHLGAMRYNRRDYAGAIKECTIALEIDPTLAEALTTRSLAFRTLKQPDRAGADLEQANRLRARGSPAARTADIRTR